jgi:protein-disulfide isomerase
MGGTALYEQIVKDNPIPKPAPIVIDVAGSPSKGAADAKVTIIQFSEFQCPFCSRVEPTIDQLLKDYDGKIKVVFKHMPLAFHADAQKAAEASMFANANGKFWEMHAKLFANQKALKIEDLKKYATEIGLDAAAMEAALNANTYKAAVDADAKAAQGAGISGTPSFVINGKLFVGAQPIDAFKKEIDAALAEAK